MNFLEETISLIFGSGGEDKFFLERQVYDSDISAKFWEIMNQHPYFLPVAGGIIGGAVGFVVGGPVGAVLGIGFGITGGLTVKCVLRGYRMEQRLAHSGICSP